DAPQAAEVVVLFEVRAVYGHHGPLLAGVNGGAAGGTDQAEVLGAHGRNTTDRPPPSAAAAFPCPQQRRSAGLEVASEPARAPHPVPERCLLRPHRPRALPSTTPQTPSAELCGKGRDSSAQRSVRRAGRRPMQRSASGTPPDAALGAGGAGPQARSRTCTASADSWFSCPSNQTASNGAADVRRSRIPWITACLAIRAASWISAPLASSAVTAAANVHPAPLTRSWPILSVAYTVAFSPSKSTSTAS